MSDTDKLDAIVSQLSELASGTEYPDEQVNFTVVLKNGKSIDIWQSLNDGGFKWSESNKG
ncbi:hypothetical protein FDI69_gp138 [Rhodococcus phage Trina]|uniref:Uncharacterized protein n=1 Tax=Rhodococcus phage Trina TaxID=2027905 RepID=A0A2D1AED5_9CAUD|nr:hypothetical protein FDI69_gp138 [Rhodococcus phage Trina]ASZ75047.1 hypothetical protein SEA_TRINA_269 [Rhodococcus phage Trina]